MAQNDLFRRYLDAGMAFTEMTRSRAEKIVRDFVKSGDVSRKDANDRVDDLVERSRRNTEQLLDMVRSEVKAQMTALGFATQDDVARIEAKLDGLASKGTSTKASAAPTAPKVPSASRVAKAAPSTPKVASAMTPKVASASTPKVANAMTPKVAKAAPSAPKVAKPATPLEPTTPGSGEA